MRVTLIDLWGREGMLHYVSQLANNLARLADVQVTVVLPKGSDVGLFEPSVTLGFVDVVRDASVGELLLAPMRLLKLPQFFRTVRRTRPDVVHLNNCHVWYIFTLPWLRQRYPIVATMHDVRPHPGQDDSWRKRKEIDTVARLSHRIFVHGEKLRQQLLTTYPLLPPDNITVIPLGDFSFLAEYQTNVREEKHTALFFGRIRAYRGLQYLVEAARAVGRRVPDARFVIAGDGDLRPYLQMLSQETHFEIHNHYIPDHEVAGFFRRASVVVLPYTEASQSGVIPIAYAFKKPVVATRVGCLPDVIEDGRTGLLVPPRDAPALAEAMLKLFGDDGLRRTLGQNGYRKMRKELGWDKIASTTLGVYREAVRGWKTDSSRS